ncbi:MAG: hypothetical protein R3D58_15410 [Saprospiraceae bacterium]|jgi:ribosomal protein S27AE|nr:TFIIB-type zinc ribbon-containing protein [Lewinellaceae bacterium]
METRTKHTYRTRLYSFIKNILVECPNCTGKALVDTGDNSIFQPMALNIRVVCGHCGYNKIIERRSNRSKQLIIGAAIDPYFHLPLWLKTEVGSDHLLWAYNMEHLDFLAAHVGAKLRERNGFRYEVKSIGAKLPRWMTAKNNRQEVLKAIRKLYSR